MKNHKLIVEEAQRHPYQTLGREQPTRHRVVEVDTLATSAVNGGERRKIDQKTVLE